MAKKKIRKKAEKQVAIRVTEDPSVYGVEAKAFMMERLCKCGRGIMRPGGKSLIAPDGKGRGIIHACTFEGCEKTETHPMPWPRPDLIPQMDPTDPNVAAYMNRARDHRLKAEAEEKADD